MARITTKQNKTIWKMPIENETVRDREIMRRNGRMKQLNVRFPAIMMEALMEYVEESGEKYALVIRHALFAFLKAKGKLV